MIQLKQAMILVIQMAVLLFLPQREASLLQLSA